MSRTPKQWLALDELGVAVAEVLTPGPWKHGYQNWTRHSEHDLILHDRCCPKCGLCISVDVFRDRTSPWMISVGPTETPCPVPDAIDIKDLNVAMEWIRKSGRTQGRLRTWHALCHVGKIVLRKSRPIIWQWAIFHAEPKHYLIAAALAAKRKD